ncbi:MAG: YceI family protein [Chitinophagaceae bacterium]|nr:YceI family protein [Chitinophagaceae bacterium]
MKKTILSLALVLATGLLFAQKKTTTSAVISFDATTALDALPKAENKTVIASLDTKTGKLAFEATIKNFAFSNPRIQEHFNNKGWMDSDNFPTAGFAGTISDLSAVKFAKNGVYMVTVKGDLTLHGVTKTIEAPATITVDGTSIKAASVFGIKLADYGVDGAAIGAGKVSKEPTITVSAGF